jgi:hypothetical protein
MIKPVPVASSFVYKNWMGEFPRKSAPWTDQEDLILKSEYKHNMQIEMMMRTHGRDRGGIESRLCKLVPEYAKKMESIRRQASERVEFNAIKKDFEDTRDNIYKTLDKMGRQIQQVQARLYR